MDASRRRLLTLIRAWIDAVAYALALGTVVTVAALTVGIATGGGFLRGKELTFLGGLALIGYATVRLWPSSVDDLGGPTASARGTRFEGLVRSLPPVRLIRLPAPPDRLRVATKLFLAGVAALAVSFLMEARFGIV